MSIRRLAVALTTVGVLTTSSVTGATAGVAAPETGIKSVTAITEIYTFGQKVSAVAVEYSANVNPRTLSPSTFTVSDSIYNFRFNPISDLDTIADRTVTRVYTNDQAMVTADGTSKLGRFVIVELDPKDAGGNTVRTSTPTSYVEVNKDLRTRVVQNEDIHAQPGNGVGLGPVLARASTTAHAPSSRVNRFADDWVQESYCCLSGVFLPYAYHLPANYDPNHKYPMVVIFPGHGMGYNGRNLGVQIVADIPATAWLRPEWKGTDEDVIVLAPQNLRVGSAAEASIAITVIDNFMKQYSVDPARVYASTVSYGSTTAWEVMSTRPGLFSAALITGGFAVSAAQAANIATDRTPIWITHGLHDPLLRVETTGRVSRDRLRSAYVAAGVDPAEVQDLVRYTEFDTPQYEEPDDHAVMGPTYRDTEILRWLLAQVH
jgi:predicted peptidase